MIFTRNCLQILKFPEFRTLVLPFYWPESFRCLRCKLSELASLRISDSRRGITTTKAQNRWPARPAAGDHRMATAFDRPRPTCLVFALLLVVEYARGTRRALPRSPAKPARYRFPRSAGRRIGRPGHSFYPSVPAVTRFPARNYGAPLKGALADRPHSKRRPRGCAMATGYEGNFPALR